MTSDVFDFLSIDRVWFLMIAAFAVEAATNLITKSEFAIRTYKKWLFNHRKNKLCEFFHELFDCGYCTSVWMSILPAYWYTNSANTVDYVIFVLIIHRLSNIIHFGIDWIQNRKGQGI